MSPAANGRFRNFANQQPENAAVIGYQQQMLFRIGQHQESGRVVLRGFQIEAPNGKWSSAAAVIQGNTVVVDTTSAPLTSAVRYAWAGYTTANLYNGVGLPASTFEAEVPYP